MKGRPLSIALMLGLMACASLVAAPRKARALTAEQAKDHVGETATVCGRVASATYAYRTRGRPTFLNLDRSYPHQIFTAVIWGRNRPRFGNPVKEYRDKNVCITGFIRVYRAQPEIVLKSPNQVEVRKGR